MKILTATLLPSLLTLLPAQAQATPLLARDADADCSCSNITTCPPRAGAAHILVSRASAESPGTGLLGPVASAVASACPGSDVVANPYPATLAEYVGSEAAGVDDLARLVREYRACCPGAGRLVLLGYSQGAQVTADFLCGRSEVGFVGTPPYGGVLADDSELVCFVLSLLCRVPILRRRAQRWSGERDGRKKRNMLIYVLVAAVVLMGDPSFVEHVPWDRGNASNKSVSPSQNHGNRSEQVTSAEKARG